MMKKYNKPEIETLALETVDVIAASEATLTTQAALETTTGTGAKGTTETISQIDTSWQW